MKKQTRDEQFLTRLHMFILLHLGALPVLSISYFMGNNEVTGFFTFGLFMMDGILYLIYGRKYFPLKSPYFSYNAMLLTHMGALPFWGIICFMTGNSIWAYATFTAFLVEFIIYWNYGLDYFQVHAITPK